VKGKYNYLVETSVLKFCRMMRIRPKGNYFQAHNLILFCVLACVHLSSIGSLWALPVAVKSDASNQIRVIAHSPSTNSEVDRPEKRTSSLESKNSRRYWPMASLPSSIRVEFLNAFGSRAISSQAERSCYTAISPPSDRAPPRLVL
jgi:hypothetical protein